jgi:hypothetical protein
MKTQILSYVTIMLTVAVMSYGWKYGRQIVERIHGFVKTCCRWIWARVPRKRTLNGKIYQAMLNERFETWKSRDA